MGLNKRERAPLSRRGRSHLWYDTREEACGEIATASVPDDLLDEQLEAASRLVDQELRVFPGHFAPTTATLIFSTDGGLILRLRDESGLAHGLRSVDADGIKPDYDLTGRYDQEGWDLDDAWIWPQARNALAQEMPYHALELRPLSNVPEASWPTGGGSVQIAGEWGWPAIPAPIRDVTVHVAREMRDSLRGGAAARAATTPSSRGGDSGRRSGATADSCPCPTETTPWRIR